MGEKLDGRVYDADWDSAVEDLTERLSGTTSYGDSLHFFALANDRFSLHNILIKLTTSFLLRSTPSPAPSSLDPSSLAS